MNRIVPVFLLSLAFVGCDYAERRSVEGERAGRLYREAMEEYAAGRLDKSIRIFRDVVRNSPGNASARFQLACLLQDHAKDSLGALCNYREYLLLSPDGDKVGIANERMSVCERKLASELILKYALGGSAAQDEANARLKEDKAKLNADLEEARNQNDKLSAEVAALKRENGRVRRMVLSGAEDGPSDGAAPKKGEGLAEAEETEDTSPSTDRIKLSGDIANLIAEEKEEVAQPAPFGDTQAVQQPKRTQPKEPPHEPRPETYVVQEGDTLFKLALRFYGRRAAWSAIRDANRTVISSDCRIKAGQQLKLP